MHLPARRGPWVIGRCIADLGLGVRIAFGVVFGHTEGTLAVVGESRHEVSVEGQEGGGDEGIG